ncbi:unnamed protein product, partial [marine sediment metagenome]
MLLVYNNPLTPEKIKEITGLEKRRSRSIINELISKYDS